MAATRMHWAEYRVSERPPAYRTLCGKTMEAYGAPLTLSFERVTCETCLAVHEAHSRGFEKRQDKG